MKFSCSQGMRQRAWLILCFIVGLGSCCKLSANQTLPELFIDDYSLVSYMASSMVESKPLPQLDNLGNGRLVKVNPTVLMASRFVVNLSTQLGLVAIRQQLIQQANQQIWSGYIENEPNSSVVISRVNGIVSGEIYYAGLVYEIQHYQDELYLVAPLDPYNNPHPQLYADLG